MSSYEIFDFFGVDVTKKLGSHNRVFTYNYIYSKQRMTMHILKHENESR